MTFNFSQLSEFRSPNVFNPWGEDDEQDAYASGGAMRLERLMQHFDCQPRFLLIGEAPGYQGCHFSGVPFTNEKLLLEGRVPRVKANLRITRRPLPWSEPSATVMWKVLHDLKIANATVMWNAFAWHPFKPGAPLSNRTPTTNELSTGLSILKAVVANFPTASVIAVGNIARDTLKYLGVDITCAVRHPSMGGANKFREGMQKVDENL
jgi:uracil-DNA glycosylase